MAAKLLFVSKDIGGTKMLVPIAREAKYAGYAVEIFCEGKGKSLWLVAGMKPYFEGTEDFQIQPFTFNATQLLNEVAPDVLLIELPGPVNIARSAGLEAMRRGIPVIMVEDFRACVKRLPEVKPSLVLTIDDVAAEIAREFLGNKIQVSVIGNHAVPNLKNYQLPEKISLGVATLRKRFDEIFVFNGRGYNTLPEINLLVSSLLKTPGNWCIIPRYHPKHRGKIDKASGKTMQEIWDEAFSPLGNRVVQLHDGDSSDMAMIADAFFCGHGWCVFCCSRQMAGREKGKGC